MSAPNSGSAFTSRTWGVHYAVMKERKALWSKALIEFGDIFRGLKDERLRARETLDRVQ